MTQPLERTKVPRITVVGTVYYQPAFGDPSSVHVRYSVLGTEDEQVYTRDLKVGEDWQPIDYGWVKRPGMVLVGNARVELNVKPTEEQRKELDARVLQLGIAGGCEDVYPFQDVPPGTSYPVTPPDFSLLRVRCLKGTVRFTVHVIPR